ncbi:histidine phosphatase family protein [Streptomyces sp. NPDC051963]|uniref:histidine phosphatase family protein n=1 Tax=Streptomyces sp. NPDC051963 TaxID=3365678 RepID=UPI0037D36FF6
MRVVLLRHGETDRNAADRFQGQADIPLNDDGVRQAQRAARSLPPGGWAAVYSSPMARAAQTAAYAAGRLDVPHHRIDGLSERHLGGLDGLHRAEFARTDPQTMARLLTDPGYAPPGGESGHAARARFCRALHSVLTAERTAERLLVVAHGGVLNLLAAALVAAHDDEPRAMVGTCRALCLDAEWTARGRARIALGRWNADPRECAGTDRPSTPVTFVDLDDLIAKEVTRT